MNVVYNDKNAESKVDSNNGTENSMFSDSNHTVLNNISAAASTATQSDLLTSFDNIFTEATTSANILILIQLLLLRLQLKNEREKR